VDPIGAAVRDPGWRRKRGAGTLRRVCAALAFAALACTNNPYPDEDSGAKILYYAFNEAPRTLDPAVSYTTNEHEILGNVFDTLLEYHYLKRPYELIPGLARAVPQARTLEDGRVAYRFALRPGVLYHDDPAFALGGAGRTTRAVVAPDIAFALHRIGDPQVNCPVIEPFRNLSGLREFSERLSELRASESFRRLPVHEQYRRAGPVDGVRVLGDLELELVVDAPFPQLLYWLAMGFSAPMAWEVVQYYDGREGRPRLADHPVGTGPYRLAHYHKQARIALERNPTWYGILHPEWRAPGATYPAEGEPGDAEAGLLDPAYVGSPLPFVERIEFRREKEGIPAFNKFLQGYYDAAGVIKESFSRVIREGALSPDMTTRGIHLTRQVDPAVFYIGFNMEDSVVGAPAGARGRKLRQAMSLAVDAEEFLRVFLNGRGVPAQSPVPPGLFGYEEDYRNPYRRVDLARARALLREAGYADGLDPRTGRALSLNFDTGDTSAQGLLQYRFFTDAWRQLGIDVAVVATTYNQFQDKVRRGAYQIFMWGWNADYPDPENFLFLLWSDMARSRNEGPNTANFSDPAYDRLYLAMKTRPNGEQRLAEIRQMRDILERERPWIELFHPERYGLYHGWQRNVKPFGMSFPMVKYRDLDPQERARLRAEWNQPVLWPLYALAVLLVLAVAPGVITFLRERQ
jgi:ABC-type transport system substrate-binding protein